MTKKDQLLNEYAAISVAMAQLEEKRVAIREKLLGKEPKEPTEVASTNGKVKHKGRWLGVADKIRDYAAKHLDAGPREVSKAVGSAEGYTARVLRELRA